MRLDAALMAPLLSGLTGDLWGEGRGQVTRDALSRFSRQGPSEGLYAGGGIGHASSQARAK